MVDEGEGYTLTQLQEIGSKWIDRIRAREKAEEDWCKEAEAAENAYLADEKAKTAVEGWEIPDFNILHSNVETIVPSIYNSTPKPDIRPRHNTPDPMAKQVADVYERTILAQIDDNVLDIEVEATSQDTFLAGRGITRVKFDADEEEYVASIDPVTMMPIVDVRPVNERVVYENVSWRDYRFGACKRFRDRPWEAFRHCISQEELDRLTDAAIENVYYREDTATKKEDLDVDVWEIWCRDSRKVYFIVDSSAKVLAIKDDPLRLKDFFSVPSIIQPITGTSSTLPVTPYKIYRRLAEEMDTATRRIAGIMKGLKVRGLIAGDAEVAELVSELGDNELAPAPNLESIVAMGGLDKAVMWWPIETAIAVLRELYVQREQTKQAIYEITGISDIIRGQGQASETATAQQIKTEWGALRIKKMQRMIERHVRDLFRVSAEIIANHFSPEALQKASGMQIDAQMMQVIKAPFDHYRIDVESDSTVRADLTRGRQEMSQFLEGTALFFQAMAPIVAQAPQAAGPVVEMYSSFARQFNLGKQAEDALDQFAEMAKQVAANPPPNPEAEAAKAESERMEREFAMREREMQTKAQIDIMKGQLDIVLKKMDIAIKREEVGMDMAKMERQAEVDAVQSGLRMEEMRVKHETMKEGPK